MMRIIFSSFPSRLVRPVAGYRYAGMAVAIFVAIFIATPARAASFDNTIRTNWINGLQQMTAQIIAGGVQMTGAVGGMIDGVVANNSARLMQQLHAEAIKDYTPGEGLCRIGTLTRALANSNMNVRINQLGLNQLLLDREAHTQRRDGAMLPSVEDSSRLAALRTRYCNPGDNDRTPIDCNCDLNNNTCTAGSGPIPQFSNRDLDFARVFDSKLTINANFNDNTLTDDERDLFSFLNNIIAYQTFPTITPTENRLRASVMPRHTFQDMRRVMAARSLIRNSFAEAVARRTPGSGAGTTFLSNVLREMGVSQQETQRLLQSETAGGVNPSYEAQMDILAKRLYQNPNFYVNLVDKPANVERMQAAMLAVKLMQRRDLFEAMLRRELLLSQLLESSIREEEKWMRVRVSRANTDDE